MTDDQPDPAATETEERTEVSVRRSPRYFRFMLTGAVVFAVVALVLTFAFPSNPTYDRGTVFGFLLAVCGVIGVVVGAVVALLLDRATARRARRVEADRIDVHTPEAEPAAEPAAETAEAGPAEVEKPEPGARTDIES